MLAEGVVPQPENPLDAAKKRIHIGTLPDWVVPCSFRMDFKPKQTGHVTYLFSSMQLHAEKRQAFVHAATRLETIQAVQNEAQGRIPFEPRTQTFTLHWLKIHRGANVVDRTVLDNLRCVQQEAGGFASPHRLTVMLLLEDVRPGDVLDLCYTIEDRPLLMSEYCGCFFTLPEGAPLGKFYFSVKFNDSRPLEWEASLPDFEPVETERGGEVQWVWTRENFPGLRAEQNTPPWHIPFPWIQVSDCPDWETVASAFAAAWDADKPVEDLAAVIPEAAGWQGSIWQQTEKAIHFVQDEYRHLALDEELDGRPPTAPDVVARRRYGDGKDLSVLLMTLLRRLGLEARLVLVNTNFRKSLAGLLPMPSLFNHLVVEYKARGEIRWVDATAKGQGGGSLNRVVGDFGVGLPVAAAGADLIGAPEAAPESNVYRIKEAVLLDTSGTSSIFGIVIAARGTHAEELRREFERQGPEAIARQRLQMCVDRFIDVKRIGQLEFRDNRTDNEFFLAEVFEIQNFLKEDAKASWYNMEVSAEAVATLLPLPISGPRNTPYALPHPCHMVHILEVYCVALPPAIVQQRTIENPWLHFTRLRKTLAGNWTITTTLSTLADAVPPDGIDEYRESVREIRSQSAWSLQVPVGQDRPHQRSDFARLPAAWEDSGPFPHAAKPAPAPRSAASAGPARSQVLRESAEGPAASSTATPAAQAGEIRYRRRKRHRRRRKQTKRIRMWQFVLVGLLVSILLLSAYEFFKKTGGMIKAPPTPDDIKSQQQP
ncbi:MAG TPA: DUF3857 domain-containing protein [Verrucomicrobiae bacterium]|jgi:hypothetical protein